MNTTCVKCGASFLIDVTLEFYQFPCSHYMCENCTSHVMECHYRCDPPGVEYIQLDRDEMRAFFTDIRKMSKLLYRWRRNPAFNHFRMNDWRTVSRDLKRLFVMSLDYADLSRIGQSNDVLEDAGTLIDDAIEDIINLMRTLCWRYRELRTFEEDLREIFPHRVFQFP